MARILKYKPVIGDKYRDWTVICDNVYKKSTNRNTYWKVQCKCGYVALRAANHMYNNKVASCQSCSKTKQSFEKSYFLRCKRRANIKNIEFDISYDYYLSLFTGYCSISNIPIFFSNSWKNKNEQTASLDRINSNMGYVKGNVQWVHKHINNMKGLLSEELFIYYCKKIYLNNE